MLPSRDSVDMGGHKKGKKKAAKKKGPKPRKVEKEKERKSEEGEHEVEDQEVKACTSKQTKEASPLEVERTDDAILLEESGLSESKSTPEDTVEAHGHALG